jgi:hypothetical protein
MRNEYNKKYYLKNKEKIKQQAKLYYKENKDKLRIYKKNWARKKRNSTNESLANSKTNKGRKNELLALSLLKNSIDCNDKIMNNKGFDIIWDGKKIDVKSCNLYKRKNKRGKPVNINNQFGWWSFNKCSGTADYYFCICNINDVPKKIYMIPKEKYKNGITISRSSNLDNYLFKIYV